MLQAQAIVDMRLRALTGLEREKLENEYKELMARIEELKAILADEKTASWRDPGRNSGDPRKNMEMTDVPASAMTYMIFPQKI